MQYSSENVSELAAALATAQAEMPNAPLNKVNPHFKSKYADLAAIRDTVTGPLAKHGLAVTQMTGTDENGQFVLFTRLSHSSGEWIAGVYPLQLGKPQEMGSALTYARRYTLAAMCGVAADEDDDANAAQGQDNGKPAAPSNKRSSPAQPPAQASKPAPPDNPIEVVDADGEVNTFRRTNRGALEAMTFIESEIDRVQKIEDQAAVWSANAKTFHALAEKVGDAAPQKGAQTIAERVAVNDKAFSKYLNSAA